MLRLSPWHCLTPFIALAMLLAAMDTCPHTTYSSTAVVTVFEDRDGDGEQDDGEPGIPDTLAVATHNIHGSFTRDMLRTDAAGQATFSADYTHVFYIEIIPPCGYRATTATFYDLGEERRARIAVGFAPESPRSGLATVRFHLWNDQDGDGVRGSDEADLGEIPLVLAFHSGSAESYWGDDLSVITDANGRATLELGNSCGTLWLWIPFHWTTSRITPGEMKGEWMIVPYDLGTTEVEWGLFAVPTPTPAPPTPSP